MNKEPLPEWQLDNGINLVYWWRKWTIANVMAYRTIHSQEWFNEIRKKKEKK